MDTSITNIQEVTINPVNANSLGPNDRPEFWMNQSDCYIWLERGYLLLSGKIEEKATNGTATAPTRTKLVNAGVLHLFNQAELKINAVTVEQVNNPALTCIPKIVSTYNDFQARQLQSMGWNNEHIMSSDGTFKNVIIPLKLLFGIGEDFRAILINSKIQLILTRARTNDNAVITTADHYSLTLSKIQLKLPFITVDDAQRLAIMKIIEKDEALPLSFRTWELHQHYDLPTTKKHTWTVRTAPQFEKPRYALVFFQSGKSDDPKKNASLFDHCSVSDVFLKLNNNSYPNENLDQDFENSDFTQFFNNYTRMSSNFNSLPDAGCLLTMEEYKSKYPIIVIDCSRQQETIKYGPIDVRLEIETKKEFPTGTTATVILIHDTVYEYQPLSNITRKYEG